MIHFAILGAGSIARSLAKTLRGMTQAGNKDIALYAVAAREQSRADAFAREFEIPKAYGSYEAMLADPEVDLVYIATPHSHHAQHMHLCIDHHKAVLCEKAFTATRQEAEAVLARAEREGVFVTEAIWTRYMPSRGMIDKLLNDGAIGRPRFLQASLGYAIEQVERIRRPELAGGALLDLGVYPLNFAAMAFGTDVAKVTASAMYMDTGVDLQENITLQYTDGRMAALQATAACLTNRSGVIYGEKGFLVVENINNPQRLLVYDAADHGALKETHVVPPQITGYEYEVEACVRALREHRLECPEMPHAETLRIMGQMDQLREG